MNPDFDLALIASAAGLIVLLVTACFAVKKRRKVEDCLRILGTGAVLTIIVLFIPLNKGLSIAFLTALQVGFLNVDYSGLFNEAREISPQYFFFLCTMCIAAPVLIGGIILTFFERAFHLLLYSCLKRFRSIYYFSELNNESFTLALSLKKRGKQHKEKFMVVFCNGGNNAAVDLISKAWEEGFVMVPYCEYNCAAKSKRKRYYLQISKDMDLNLSSTKKLINSLNKNKMNNKNVRVYLFSDQTEAEIILNSTDKQGLEVMIINEETTIAYDLMFHKPLYEALEKSHSKKLSVLIVGQGGIGKEILKAVLWCGQMGDGYSLSVKAVDKNAEYLRSVFLKDCPEMTSNNYDIDFITADVNTEGFERVLDESCGNCNYIVVCLGDDELNIKTSLFLRGYYIRKSADFNNEPIIAAVVMCDIKSECVKEMTAVNKERINKKGWQRSPDKSQNYNIHAFGAYSDIYSYEFILNSEIEKLSLNAHAVYELVFSGGKADQEEIRTSYFLNEINKRSSRANAIHIKYKLYSLGFLMYSKENAPEGKTACGETLIERLADEESVYNLSKLDHLRWNAFQRSEGYRGAAIEQAMKYKAFTNNSHKHQRSKLHACICDWEELDKVAEIFDPNFKKYDENFIRLIPQIIGVVHDERINLSGVQYSVYPR